MTSLYRISPSGLEPVRATSLPSEELLEQWVSEDPSLIGLDILVLGRQVRTAYNGRIDILGIDREGNLTILELKRDRTPRDIVAQILDYASWAHGLNTREVHEVANQYLQMPFVDAFKKHFQQNVPETLNNNTNMVIVASDFDAPSKRIVEYLNQTHGVSINSAFFRVFDDGGSQYLATDWLMDQEDVVQRAESKRKAPWTGKYYVNVGDDPNMRSWMDMKKFGFVSAGNGRFYSKRLEQLSEGDQIYAYQKGMGYVGFGTVNVSATKADEFRFPDGRMVEELDLNCPHLLHDSDDPEMAEYLVGVDWHTTYNLADAKTRSGIFANQNVVCKLRDEGTLEFLEHHFS
ncbi:endonuclease NucS domain-containing protein [Thalassospira povalilytica]|uniref:endonuclease NucS domain-containing protein n=1 Tax=Thalassospira povalilytica TaxID=732237 RepID=UPI001D188EB8|nr:endonuclease NucS domain-containing protein [Thalassospira povalilytica]MCC4242369.1 endonuclease NucS [Thalassospira povalilytica]